MQTIAHGIESYYWQGTYCNSQEYFTKTGELLQSTTAKGASFDRGDTKSASSVSSLLGPISNDYCDFYFLAFHTAYHQWNLPGGSADVTATGRDAIKSQFYIGGTGADTYKFSGSWGSDTILNSDGQCSIVIDGVILQSGKRSRAWKGCGATPIRDIATPRCASRASGLWLQPGQRVEHGSGTEVVEHAVCAKRERRQRTCY
jgi:hypothetical protein